MQKDPVLLNDWHPIAPTVALANSPLIAARLLDEDIVVWRASEDQLTGNTVTQAKICAWRDTCIHRGTKLSLGKIIHGNTLQCPYHGWLFDDQGQCVKIPALPDHQPTQRARIKTFAVQEAYDMIWVCLGQADKPIVAFPEWDKADFRKLLCGPYTVQTSGPRIIENFLDVSHFPFVHENILGTQQHSEIADYTVTTGANGVLASNVTVYQPDPYGTGKGDTVAYTYHAPRPLSAYLLKESAGPKFSILLFITPLSETESTAWMWMAMNYGHAIPAQELLAWQDSIFAQDKPILESQSPQRLPLDPSAELSMRSDKIAVNYRRWLQTLGLRYGVITA